MTALMVASVRGHTATVQVLLEAGAASNAEDWVRHLESERLKHAEMVEGKDEEEGMSVKALHNGCTTACAQGQCARVIPVLLIERSLLIGAFFWRG